MGVIEFRKFPKIPRLYRDVVITEKIDGTNGAIIITDDEVRAQSQNRLLTVDEDHFGFAGWVDSNHEDLRNVLGVGRHYGEWWGAGINRGYGFKSGERYFSLFNTARHDENVATEITWNNDFGLRVVPVIYEGPFAEIAVQRSLADLRTYGSSATPHRYDRPEGIVVYHKQANYLFKVTLENDDQPKDVTIFPQDSVLGVAV